MQTVRVSISAVKASFADALWPVLPWLFGKFLRMEPNWLADLIRNEPLRQLWREWVWWDYCLVRPERKGVYAYAVFALSPSWYRRSRRQLKRWLVSTVRGLLMSEAGSLLVELRRQMWRLQLLKVLQEKLATLEGRAGRGR